MASNQTYKVEDMEENKENSAKNRPRKGKILVFAPILENVAMVALIGAILGFFVFSSYYFILHDVK